MNIRQLRYFVCVAEEGNFGRAAKRLHISQPPLSQQIKALEESLGVTLFTRGRHGATLTHAGKALLVHARDVLNDFHALAPMVRRVASGLEGVIRIGILSSVMHGPLPTALRRFQEHSPNVEWTLKELLPEQQKKALKNNAIDVGFTRNKTDSDALQSTLIYEDELRLALPAAHRLAHRSRVRLDELVEEPFILMNTASPVISNFIRACAEQQFQPTVIYESVDPHTVLNLVDANLGITVMPQSLAATIRKNVVFVPLAGKRLDASIYATFQKNHTLAALHVLMDILRDVMAHDKSVIAKQAR